jgi:hypothetical protein
VRASDAGCTACFGGTVPCKGGGNKLCWRRDKRPAHLAIIVDSYGGARTIVGTRFSIKCNTRHDELCHVVPGLIVHEPIAWNDIPVVIARAKLEFERWLDRRPNLDKQQYTCVTFYRLRQLERENVRALNLAEVVE